MAILQMETEHTRSVGRQLGHVANGLIGCSNSLVSSWDSLLAEWEGPSSDSYAYECTSLRSRLNSLAAELDNLGLRVQREVDEWEAVDSNGVFGFTGLVKDGFPNGILGPGIVLGSISQLPGDFNIGDTLVWLGNHTDTIKFGLGLIGLSGLGFIAGGTYAGQVIITGSHLSKELAGLSPHLTHIAANNVPAHMVKSAVKSGVTKLDVASAGLKVAGQWVKDYREYGDDPARLLSALAIDTVLVGGVSLVSGYAGDVIGTAIGATLGSAIPVVGTAAGAVVGGIVGRFVAGWLADEHITKPMLESKWRENAIEAGGEIITDATSTVKDLYNSAVDAIQDFSMPRLEFS